MTAKSDERTTITPLTTVLMPVFNGEAYLREAMDSILHQTFSDFEFLIMDDGSTDSSLEIIESCNDSRILVVRNHENIGLTHTLNRGFDLAKGKYIARMDADDIALPRRLERQVAFMEQNKDVCVCGTWVKAFGEGRKAQIWSYPASPEMLNVAMLFFSAIAHPSAILRGEYIRSNKIRYSKDFPQAQDWELWQRLSRETKLANIPEVLLRYRIHPQSVGRTHGKGQQDSAAIIRRRGLEFLGISPSKQEEALNEKIFYYRTGKTQIFALEAEKWLVKLVNANTHLAICKRNAFDKFMAEKWFSICSQITFLGLWTLKHYFSSPLRDSSVIGLKQLLKFTIKCLLRWDSSPRKTFGTSV